MVLIFPYLEQDTLLRHWDLKKPYYQQTDVARLMTLENYFCPSRRDKYGPPMASLFGDEDPITGKHVPGALSDYAGNWGLADL